MRVSQQKLQNLLSNISKGLKTKSVDELNNAIEDVINNDHDKKEDINYVLQVIANGYSISVRTLKTARATPADEVAQARRIASCIFHYQLKLSTRYIAKKVYCQKSHTTVAKDIRSLSSLNLKVKTDRDFHEKYEQYTKIWLEHTTNNNVQIEIPPLPPTS